MQKYYTVTAYRWGHYENHSYLVGVFGNSNSSISAAIEEEANRGGNKYFCEVREHELNKHAQGKVIWGNVHAWKEPKHETTYNPKNRDSEKIDELLQKLDAVARDFDFEYGLPLSEDSVRSRLRKIISEWIDEKEGNFQ